MAGRMTIAIAAVVAVAIAIAVGERAVVEVHGLGGFIGGVLGGIREVVVDVVAVGGGGADLFLFLGLEVVAGGRRAVSMSTLGVGVGRMVAVVFARRLGA